MPCNVHNANGRLHRGHRRRTARPSSPISTSVVMVAFRGIAEGVENSNFSPAPPPATLFSTLYEETGGSRRNYPGFSGSMKHLARRGIVCPQPVRRARRRGVAATWPAGSRRLPLFCPVYGRAVCALEHCAPVGLRWWRLHLAGADFSPTRSERAGPRRLADAAGAQPAAPAPTSVQPGLGEELQTALDAHSRRPGRSGLPVGHIHADLFPDNVFFLDGRLSGLIDFYLAATDIFGLRPRGVFERLVLRAGLFPQRDQGAGDAAGLRRDPKTSRRPSWRRCRCYARVRRSGSR